MYDKRAKQDALDLWFSMPGEMSVDDFAAELGYPSGSTLRNWIKADPRHDPDKCQYRSKPVLPKLEAIRRVAEPAGAMIIAAMWLHTPFSAADWAGLVLMAAMIVLVSLSGRSVDRRTDTP